VADLQSEVPQKAHKYFDWRGGRRRAAFEENHDVDVGGGVQFASPVAADGDERHGQAFEGAAKMMLPRADQQGIDQPGVQRNNLRRAARRRHVVLSQAVASVSKGCPKRLEGVCGTGQCAFERFGVEDVVAINPRLHDAPFAEGVRIS